MLAWARRIAASCTACGMGLATDVPPHAVTARCTGDGARAIVWRRHRMARAAISADAVEAGAPTGEDVINVIDVIDEAGAPTGEDSVGEGFPVGAADDGRRRVTGRWLHSRVGEVGCCASRCCRRCSCHSRRCWRVWSCCSCSLRSRSSSCNDSGGGIGGGGSGCAHGGGGGGGGCQR